MNAVNALHANARRKARILVVDDDPGLLRLLTIRLRAENFDVEAVESGPLALSATGRFRPDLVISDLRMDPMDGISLLKELQTRWPGLKVIMLTAHGTIPDAVQATQMGAFGFLTKPVDKRELLDQVNKALRISGFASSDEDWRSEIVTRSPLMEEKLAQAHMVAGTDARVLIVGESGTGKELLARAIHRASPRRGRPFVVASCSAGSEDQLEIEFFGRDRGPGAGDARFQRGAFQASEGGTLLLDELADIPAGLQAKLLRLLQQNTVRPVGSGEASPCNVRVISATSRDPSQLIASGRMREDLYYRLNVVHIDVPPLNRRREDIPQLVRMCSRKSHASPRCARFSLPKPLSCSLPQTGPAMCVSCSTLLDRRLRSRKHPSFRWSWCNSRWVARWAAYPLSTRRATNSRVVICRKFCRSPLATSVKRRVSRDVIVPTSTSCWAAIS